MKAEKQKQNGASIAELLDALTQTRAERARRLGTLKTLESAPLSRPEQHQAVQDRVAQAGRECNLNVAALAHGEGQFRPPSTLEGLWNCLCKAQPDGMVQFLLGLLNEQPEGPTRAERQKQLPIEEAAIARLEVREEELIDALEGLGYQDIIRRGDMALALIADDRRKVNRLILLGRSQSAATLQLWERNREILAKRARIAMELQNVDRLRSTMQAAIYEARREELQADYDRLTLDYEEIQQDIAALNERRTESLRLSERLEQFVEEREEAARLTLAAERNQRSRPTPPPSTRTIPSPYVGSNVL